MTDKTLLIVGNDKISAQALAALQLDQRIIVAIDRSTSVGRVFKLVRRGSLTIGLVMQMLWCELRRSAPPVDIVTESIASNLDLVQLISLHVPSRVVLFRAGLIINRAVLATGVPIMNIHCAKVPEFGGIGSIKKALCARVYAQCATLHQVTESIDKGVVLDTEGYELDPTRSYCENENRAYAAGQRLLLRTLMQPQAAPVACVR